MYINAGHIRAERRKPVPDARNAKVLPDLRETVAGYRHRALLQQRPVRKQVHSYGGTQKTMSEKERQSAADMKEAREKLLECFPGSFINEVDEFIAHPRTNQYFILRDCKTVEAVEAKVLEYLSRAAFKSQPYSQEWRNRRLHEFMLSGINAFLDTDFSYEDMELIYTYMGGGIKHGLTLVFIDHDMSMKWLRSQISESGVF